MDSEKRGEEANSNFQSIPANSRGEGGIIHLISDTLISSLSGRHHLFQERIRKKLEKVQFSLHVKTAMDTQESMTLRPQRAKIMWPT